MTRESTFWSRISLDAGARRLRELRRSCKHESTSTVIRFGERIDTCLVCGQVVHRETIA